MSFECEFCKKCYSTKGSLNNHQRTAKYCIKIQSLSEKNSSNINYKSFDCKYCKKTFSSNFNMNKHIKLCPSYYQALLSNKDNELENKDSKIKELQVKIDSLVQLQKEEKLKLQAENELLHKQLENLTSKDIEKISELQDKLQEIAIVAIDQKNEVISSMVKKYVKKQPRKKFDCSNVVYILTTTSLKKDRRYILGKAKNLTNRLSTYNKTDEHEVIFYQVCDDEESMNALEPLVFKKLGQYREQANRERFILPDNNNIDLFIDTIKNCFEFLK